MRLPESLIICTLPPNSFIAITIFALDDLSFVLFDAALSAELQASFLCTMVHLPLELGNDIIRSS